MKQVGDMISWDQGQIIPITAHQNPLNITNTFVYLEPDASLYEIRSLTALLQERSVYIHIINNTDKTIILKNAYAGAGDNQILTENDLDHTLPAYGIIELQYNDVAGRTGWWLE